MSALDTAAFIILWLLVAAMILVFLWTVREIWRRYVRPMFAPKGRPFIHYGGNDK